MQIVEELTKSFHKRPTPEEIFYYIYAVFYSNTYRTKYAEFLKTDFPRVPFTKRHKLFVEMGKYGKELVELHLLKSSELDTPVARFQGEGDNRVEKPRYEEKEGRVYINATQYFEGVEPEVWEYQIGGYQVMEKWLKDRKGRTLSLEDIQHYCRIGSALKKTIETQEKIDSIYVRIEEDTTSFSQKK
jgi:predicted helicase